MVIREEVLAWFEPRYDAPRLLNLEGLVNVDPGAVVNPRLLNLEGLVNVDPGAVVNPRLLNLEGLVNVDPGAVVNPRLLNLEGLVNVAQTEYRKTALQRFLKYHEEFKLNYKEMGDYYLDDVE
jgi:hypothetical protein